MLLNLAISLLVCLPAGTPGTVDANNVKLVSKDAQGAAGATYSLLPSLSKSGRYVAFMTSSPNLLPGVTANGKVQIVRKDTKTGALKIVSLNADGALANANCEQPVISANGKRVAFASRATNLDGAVNSHTQVFWKNLVTGEVRRISNSLIDAPANQDCRWLSISDDGDAVAFASNASNLPDALSTRLFAYRWTAKTGEVERACYGANGEDPDEICVIGNISGNGRFVSFYTDAANMGFAQAATNNVNAFLRDMKRRKTTLVAPGAHGEPANGGTMLPSVSANGRYVAFISAATNLLKSPTPSGLALFVTDRALGKTKRLTVPYVEPASSPLSLAISGNGRKILVGLSGMLPPPSMISVEWCSIIDRKTGVGHAKTVTNGDYIGLQDSLEFPTLSGNGKRFAFASGSQLLLDGASIAEQIFVAKP